MPTRWLRTINGIIAHAGRMLPHWMRCNSAVTRVSVWKSAMVTVCPASRRGSKTSRV